MKMGRRECVKALSEIQYTLKVLADADKFWDPESGRWVSDEKTTAGEPRLYDMTGTLAESLKANRFRLVARWVEFHTESGPSQRARLWEVVTGSLKEFRYIEGSTYFDPFRWLNVSRDDAARKATREVRHAADYVGELKQLIAAKPATAEPTSVNKYGRRPDGGVAKRRKEVKRLHAKRKSHDEIFVELRNLQNTNKLPQGIPISIDIIKKDIERA